MALSEFLPFPTTPTFAVPPFQGPLRRSYRPAPGLSHARQVAVSPSTRHQLTVSNPEPCVLSDGSDVSGVTAALRCARMQLWRARAQRNRAKVTLAMCFLLCGKGHRWTLD